MANQEAVTNALGAGAKKDEKLVKLMPTLFIGVGGSGMEAILRVRRRILNATWNPANPHRVTSLAEFPVAQFIHFDLAIHEVQEQGKAQHLDPIAELVQLKDEDRLCKAFEISNYCSSDNDLDKFPLVKEWSPLAPAKIRELGIDPTKGAGQIRAISRLYFFDQYRTVRDKIRTKLLSLKHALSSRDQFERLGLKSESEKLRIVVVCSLAGGTGSGSFLDMGYLAKSVATQDVGATDVHLFAMMPTGYSTAGKQRTEANGYAALMELETCMRGGFKYVTAWDENDARRLPDRPYDEVYLVDSGNLAGQHTGDQKDVYEMLADTLFEDFGSADFANRKRSVAVNQAQHKITPYHPRVPEGRFGDMKLNYHKGYSALGQAVIDTQEALRRDILAHGWMAEMLKAFFGVASADPRANRATDKQRDEFMATHLKLAPMAFSDFPDFSARSVELRLTTGEFFDYALTEELLSDRRGSVVAGVQQKVDAQLEAIQQQFDKDEWHTQVREALKQLERDVLRDQDAAADVVSDRVEQRRKELFQELTRAIDAKLFEYLDKREFGGLEYVLSLVEQIKDRLENPGTGLVPACELNEKRYAEIRDALRTHEYERLLNNLSETKGFSLFGSGKTQAEKVMTHLKTEIGNYLKFHLRATACNQAAKLLHDVSNWLGKRQGADPHGNALWNGFVGELQDGRNAVLDMLDGIQRTVTQLREDTRREHATYIFVESPELVQALPPADRLADSAKEVFDNYGGSRQLFAMLRNDAERAKLFAGLRAQADRMLALSGPSEQMTDPLLDALESMGPNLRQRKFSELLARSMPWVHANLGGEFKPDGDQFKCFIGVNRSADFERFEEELKAQLPSGSGVSRQQVQLVDTGVPGRMVCYVELSGMPLTVLRGLETWRTSYRIESPKIPTHTHKDLTRFVHPLVPSADQLEKLAEDFGIFAQAVALGVIFRNPSRNVSPPGQYKVELEGGDQRNIGNERAHRMDGFASAFRQKITDAVEERVAALKPIQLCALSSLFGYWARQVYTPLVISDDKGAETDRQGFASKICETLQSEFRARAERKGEEPGQIVAWIKALDKARAKWTVVVEDSDADGYPWEVQPPGDSEVPRLKRVVKPEIFDANWLLRTVPDLIPDDSGRGKPARDGNSLPRISDWWVAVDGQKSGPHDQRGLEKLIECGQFKSNSKVWKKGVTSNWVPAVEVAELASLFDEPPPLDEEPPSIT